MDFGWCIVRDGEVEDRGYFLLDWTMRPEYVTRDFLELKLNMLDRVYAWKNLEYMYSIARLQSEGRDPVWVLKFMAELFKMNREAGAKFVGHNAIAFDSKLAVKSLLEFADVSWAWHQDEIVDTGVLEKVIGCLDYADPAKQLSPKPGESLFKFSKRAAAANRPGVKWNVAECVERYGLCESHDLCLDQLHGAGADAYACHLLVESHRKGTTLDVRKRKTAEAAASARNQKS